MPTAKKPLRCAAFLPGGEPAGEAADAAVEAFTAAENAVIFFGSEGLGLEGSRALADACAELLLADQPYRPAEQRPGRCLAEGQPAGRLGYGLCAGG